MYLKLKVFNHEIIISRILSKREIKKIKKWVNNGHFTDAVILCRKATHWGLLECKQYCDCFRKEIKEAL